MKHYAIYVISTDVRGHQQGSLYGTNITVEKLPQMVFQALKHTGKIEVIEDD